MHIQPAPFFGSKNANVLTVVVTLVLGAHALLALGFLNANNKSLVTNERKHEIEVMINPKPGMAPLAITEPPFDPFVFSTSHLPPVSADPSIELDNCKPDYPPSALLKREKGVTRLRFKLAADGQLLSTAIVKSSGHTVLDRAAVDALSKCTFYPKMNGGISVKSTLVTDYIWSIE